MDNKLVAWAHAVKARRGPGGPPPLWLFTDARAHPDLPDAIARLPRRLCGVVFRHDGAPDRGALGQAVARICRARGLTLSVAGDWRLAARLRAGLHLRGGRRRGVAPRSLAVATASAHGTRDVRRARAAGAGLIFASPVFPTASHPGAAGIGVLRWRALARDGRGRTAALGGIDGGTIRRFGIRPPAAVGAIGALS